MSITKVDPANIDKVLEEASRYIVSIENGDLRALQEVVEKWQFKDAESALRFALAVMSLAAEKKIFVKDASGKEQIYTPAGALLKQVATPPASSTTTPP